VLLNLAINARDAVQEVLDGERQIQPGLRTEEIARGEGVSIRLETSNVILTGEEEPPHVQRRPGEFVRLRVMDNGGGIPPEVLPRIFEPFFTTKGPDRGTGLGLAMVFGIVQQHRGWIECQSQLGQGTTFDIYLPRTQEEQSDSARSRIAATAPGRGTILLVDDEPMLLNLGRTVLQKVGYKVLLASDGEQAVDLYRRAGAEIDLVILDRTMPRLSGRDTLRLMLQLNPQVRVLIASGYAVDQLSAEEREHVRGFLAKPYSPDELVEAVRSVLEAKADP
jgi:CheY-like chemotaxis protein